MFQLAGVALWNTNIAIKTKRFALEFEQMNRSTEVRGVHPINRVVRAIMPSETTPAAHLDRQRHFAHLVTHRSKLQRASHFVQFSTEEKNL